MLPTKKQIRVMLVWMQDNDIITFHGLKKFERPNQGAPSSQTRHYLATKITVINYDTYQSEESYKGTHKAPPSAELVKTVLKELKKKEKD